MAAAAVSPQLAARRLHLYPRRRSFTMQRPPPTIQPAPPLLSSQSRQQQLLQQNQHQQQQNQHQQQNHHRQQNQHQLQNQHQQQEQQHQHHQQKQIHVFRPPQQPEQNHRQADPEMQGGLHQQPQRHLAGPVEDRGNSGDGASLGEPKPPAEGPLDEKPPSSHHHSHPHPDPNHLHSLSIEQLFEDSYSLSLAGPPSSLPQARPISEHVGLPTASNGDLGVKGSRALPASRVVAAQRRLAKMSFRNLATSATKATSTRSTSVDPPSRRKTSSAVSVPAATSRGVTHRHSDVDASVTRPLVSRTSRRGGSASSVSSGGQASLVVSGLQAAKDHAAKLTDWEKTEIKIFKTIYYLGHLSAKKAAREEAAKDGFDDKEGFYICKPRDHLLYRYEIQDLLGKGTFGQVVKAFDHKTNSLVAMKIVKNERPFLKQAKEEVRILEVLRKQDRNDFLNVVHILDSFKFRGHACIAFELLGISLHQLLKKTRGQGFTVGKVQRVTRGILRCLEALSKNRIIHCDIKPENILLRRSAPGHSLSTGAGSSDYSVKVIDFGSSCYEQQQIYTYIQSRYYRAPEVVLGSRYSCAIDMWSLACVIGELLTAQPLFPGTDEADQLACMMEVLGVPPSGVIGRGRRSDKFFQGATPRYVNSSTTRSRRGPPGSLSLASALKNTDDELFLDFMRRCLLWDPALRLTPGEALQHPWMLRGQTSRSAGIDPRASPHITQAFIAKAKSVDKAAQHAADSHLRGGSGHKNSTTASASTRTMSTSTIQDTGSGKGGPLTAKLPHRVLRSTTAGSKLGHVA